MSTLCETSLSLLSQSNSPTPPSSFAASMLVAVFAAVAGIYYASPMRLTRALVSALADVENAYLKGAENGVVLFTDIYIMERLAILQLKTSTLRENSLRSSLSLSPFSFLFNMLNISRSVAILRCLAEVRGLGTRIEILHESKLRKLAPTFESHCQCRASIFLRRRESPHAPSM